MHLTTLEQKIKKYSLSKVWRDAATWGVGKEWTENSEVLMTFFKTALSWEGKKLR